MGSYGDILSLPLIGYIWTSSLSLTVCSTAIADAYIDPNLGRLETRTLPKSDTSRMLLAERIAYTYCLTFTCPLIFRYPLPPVFIAAPPTVLCC
ncbi:hypothetical protein J6590_070149 [Homalodisca vitripennis]|nr:hypothetical protein J6590_070149 [Homalodisca vitripennis]